MNFNRVLLAFALTALFVLGFQSFITSSEFWPMYASKNYFFFSLQWASLYMKPLFNFVLFFFYLFPLSDVQHIQSVKFLFALNGCLQFYLFYRIFNVLLSSRSHWLALFLAVLAITTPYYFSQYFRIRSDQLALTLFLFFIYINVVHYKFCSAWNLFFILLFPLIGFKHIYFSVAAFSLLNLRKTFSFIRVSDKSEKIILVILLTGVAIWTVNLAVKSANYFFGSFNNFFTSSGELVLFLKVECFLLGFSTLCFLHSGFRQDLKSLSLEKLPFMHGIVLVILLVHPQKFNFFIASLSPLLYFSVVLFLIYLFKSKSNKYFQSALITIIIFQSLSIFHASQQMKLVSSDQVQLEAIEKISKVISQNRLSYLDGMGLLPRQNNTGCFVSPEDFQSNESCRTQIFQGTADSIIFTTRLMSLGVESAVIEKLGYESIGPNLYVKKSLVAALKKSDMNWPAPALIFGGYDFY